MGLGGWQFIGESHRSFSPSQDEDNVSLVILSTVYVRIVNDVAPCFLSLRLNFHCEKFFEKIHSYKTMHT